MTHLPFSLLTWRSQVSSISSDTQFLVYTQCCINQTWRKKLTLRSQAPGISSDTFSPVYPQSYSPVSIKHANSTHPDGPGTRYIQRQTFPSMQPLLSVTSGQNHLTRWHRAPSISSDTFSPFIHAQCCISIEHAKSTHHEEPSTRYIQ